MQAALNIAVGYIYPYAGWRHLAATIHWYTKEPTYPLTQ